MEETNSMASKIKAYSDALNAVLVDDIKSMIDQEFSSLTSKQSVLLELLKDHAKTVTEIAEQLSTTPSAVSQLISKLERLGFVKREINLQNRREIIVSLDDKGKRYHEMISQIELHIIQKYYLRLEKDDLENLLDIYQKLYKIALEVNKK